MPNIAKRKTTESGISQGSVLHETVSIHSLVPHEANYNTHPQEQLGDLKASLRRYGQVEDTVVKALADGTYKIAAHEGVTTAALQLLALGECPHLAQWNVTIVPASWTEIDVRGYMVTSNETTRKSVPDDNLLATLLQEQADAGMDLASLGTDEEALRQLFESLGDETLPTFAPGRVDEQGKLDEKASVICPQCGHRFEPV